MYSQQIMDPEYDVLFEKTCVHQIADLAKQTFPVYLLEYLRINKSYNLFVLGENGFLFLKVQPQWQAQTKRFDITQRKQVPFRKILTASYDFRSECVGIVFENEPGSLKVFALDEAFFKSQTPLHRIQISSVKSPWKEAYLFDQSSNFYSASVEFRKRIRAMNYENKIDLTVLYNSLHAIYTCSKQGKLAITELESQSESTWMIRESGELIRRGEHDLSRQSSHFTLQC